MKITFFTLEDWEKEYIEKHEDFKKLKAKAVFVDEALDEGHIPQDTFAEVLCVFIDSTVTESVLGKFPNLKCITTRSTGFDHIDVQACKKRGIRIANVPSYGEDTVAEYTFGLILALVRKIYQGYDQIRETGSFSKKGLRGIDLKGKTLGVIGTGKIGRNVIQIAKGFEMNIIACDVLPDDEYAKEVGFGYRDQQKLLEHSDIVTIHAPYMKSTHHLINAKNIVSMKHGAYLINTSRGGLVETAALIRSLKDGRLAGAALDVLEEEAIIQDELELLLEGRPEEHDLQTVLANHVLIDMPNVIITPHNAFNTWEALKRILDTTMQNLQAFQGGKPINLVEIRSSV